MTLKFPKPNCAKERELKKRAKKSVWLVKREAIKALDGRCMNPFADHHCEGLTVHHIRPRRRIDHEAKWLITMCEGIRGCHDRVQEDHKLMLQILRYYEGKPCDRWGEARAWLERKADHGLEAKK